MNSVCEKCGGLIALSEEDYDVSLGCECPVNQTGESSEETDEEPEECIY